MASGGGFRSFDHGAVDVVLAAAFNSSGTRVAICSADHKIRIYNIEQDNSWTLMDQWRGHDGEVLDASCSYIAANFMRWEFIWRSTGLGLLWGKYSVPSAAITNSSFGARTLLKHPEVVVVSDASSLNLRVIMLRMFPLTSRPLSTRCG